MEDFKKELADLLNSALKLEHGARIQYLTHAESVKGLGAEKIIERLTEIASDEEKHEGQFRNLIGNYLYSVPTMEISSTEYAYKIEDILELNLRKEKEAIEFYKKIYKKLTENKDRLPYEFETLEHAVRHVIIGEQEHVAELSILLGK